MFEPPCTATDLGSADPIELRRCVHSRVASGRQSALIAQDPGVADQAIDNRRCQGRIKQCREAGDPIG